MTDEQIKEAGWTAQSVTGAIACLHGVGYDVETFKQEVNRAVDYIKQIAKKAA